MTNLLPNIVSQIHLTGYRAVIAVTGGGSAALSRLLSEPGASRTVLEALVPYHEYALAEFLGGKPDQSCSEKTARAMAMAAFQRALDLQPGANHRHLLGVGATAALATDRRRRGENKVFVCVQSLATTREASLYLDAERSRAEEEDVAAQLIIDILAESCGLPVDLVMAASATGRFAERCTVGQPAWQKLLNGESQSTHEVGSTPEILFPGAFNPMHDGHRTMVRLAEAMLGGTVTLEISAFNVDKPPLDYFDMMHRESALGGEYPLIFTHAPTFVEKAAIFPEIPFVVGVDTVKRIADPRYYGGSEDSCLSAIATIAEYGNTFLVFGRQLGSSFETLDDLQLPKVLTSICRGVEEEMFRHDISSRQLRRRRE